MVSLTKVIGKIVEAWQMLWFRSLIKIKIGESVLRMICEFSTPFPSLRTFRGLGLKMLMVVEVP